MTLRLTLAFILSAAVLSLRDEVAVGDTVMTEGFVMDQYCINDGFMLDNPREKTLERPDLHSIHCLVDVSSCTSSPFEILGDPTTPGGMYTRKYQVDPSARSALIALARKEGLKGPCTTCTSGEGTMRRGFRARVSGTVTALSGIGPDAPPLLSVNQIALPGEATSSPSAAPVAKPTQFPTPRPTSAPIPLPTAVPSRMPLQLSPRPTIAPSVQPTMAPTSSPTTTAPAASPTEPPSTSSPTTTAPEAPPTEPPTLQPIETASPTKDATSNPTTLTVDPTASPIATPTDSPMSTPSSMNPTNSPSDPTTPTDPGTSAAFPWNSFVVSICNGLVLAALFYV